MCLESFCQISSVSTLHKFFQDSILRSGLLAIRPSNAVFCNSYAHEICLFYPLISGIYRYLRTFIFVLQFDTHLVGPAPSTFHFQRSASFLLRFKKALSQTQDGQTLSSASSQPLSCVALDPLMEEQCITSFGISYFHFCSIRFYFEMESHAAQAGLKCIRQLTTALNCGFSCLPLSSPVITSVHDHIWFYDVLCMELRASRSLGECPN